jgi:exopolysaccharide production protein ExoZ
MSRRDPRPNDSGPASGLNVTEEPKYFRLQYLRAFAALCVVVFHSSYYMQSIRGDDRFMSATPSILGGIGVYLFFVTSGYLMAVLAKRTSPYQFICHRIIRIYPIYWILLCVSAFVKVGLGDGFTLDPFAIALAPGDGRHYLLGVEWTLPFELSF